MSELTAERGKKLELTYKFFETSNVHSWTTLGKTKLPILKDDTYSEISNDLILIMYLEDEEF